MKGTCDIWLKAKVAAVFQGEEKEREIEEGKMRNILLKPEIIHHDGITDPSKLLFTLNFS